MSKVGVSANLYQPSKRCFKCNSWKPATVLYGGAVLGGYCKSGYCKKDSKKKRENKWLN